ncbi:Uncharacterised protein [Legionella wadsworthii]|uniref:Secreted protein n=1 Tax=Legionella wadsworthii TaxID=28088 RepID=A0A378LUZ2_9GAMM|nr:hypothetical protein [Legionella wadsworthii]STY31127.1 Uncharacterised protein [Legionella wadsworthii]
MCSKSKFVLIRQMIFSSLTLLSSSVVYSAQKTVMCQMQGLKQPISFKTPDKMGDLPNIDFDYPVNVTRFSLRDDNLLVVAMDQEEKDRPRIFISAQLNPQKQKYLGQFMTDFGGNELQLDNGIVSCVVK